MGRLLFIKSIEGRVLAGITMFVGMMILVGWVAINEEARMQAFVRQHTGRSIERGAELFASLCSECHGEEGYGAKDRAPGLNNPHLFGYDPVGLQSAAIINANRTLVRLNKNADSLLNEMMNAENPPAEERQNEILAEIAELEARMEEQQAAIDAAVAERAAKLKSLDAAVKRGLYPLWDTIEDSESTAENEVEAFFFNNGTRLAQVGWASDLHGYIVTTLIHGRPGSGNVWLSSEGMAAWSQLAGAQLRQDQIEDLAAYVLNWDKGSAWSDEDFIAVLQYGKPLADGSLPREPGPPTAGDNINSIFAFWEENEIVGSAATGSILYTEDYGCTDCHGKGTAPDTVGTLERVMNERLAMPQFAGYSVEQYLVESITNPGIFVVDGYASGLMPANFGGRMTHQQLADIVAYLLSQ